MKNSYENDENTYCHGVVNCKYYRGECIFMDMGSGNPDDMPCRVQESEDLKAFREWREKREKEQKGDCENCVFRKFTAKFIDDLVKVMAKNGIESVEQLMEILKGGNK